ncbi:MAG: hypothetical protein K9N09_10320 [Candidatus Cloacimonetes bacterium]|nr:hypothetical protein [Candidatus Cloacimonadota bacterium]MCF7814606.1 hypothetical protein [Candidatus Cloacimonadota bacterium]MCF7869086.1 hypothetical protein [Candidatus Cloacimonadota bacterium]MCF7884503.1 hypothetical protein [Candidatus Cloacimonadota bacterium]
MNTIKEIEQKLKARFPAEDIEYRVVRVSKDSRRALILPYITSRAVMDRLDEVIGCANWSDEYEVLETGVTCKLSLQLEDRIISKEDAAPFTNIEALKGAFSDALKRAAVKFGIGRYLYKQPDSYVDILPQKPATAKGKVHYYHSRELSGWWIEPKLLSDGRIEEKTSPKKTGSPKDDTAEFKALTLPQKLAKLAELEIISAKKKSNYEAKINDKSTAPGLRVYFEKQFELLYSLHCLAQNSKVSDATKATIYKRIMSSRLNGFPAIENEIKELEAA